MKKCAIYCRVSRNEQSCERQLFELREVAENHKYQIISEYVDEGVSGIKESRPEFDRMMNDVHIRKFDILLVVELSRLGRSVKQMCNISDTLKHKNIDLYVKNQNIDTSTITGQLFFNIVNAISQYERQLTIERIMSGLDNAKRQGKRLGRKSKIDVCLKKKVIKLKNKNCGINEIGRKCNIGKGTIYKILKEVA